MAVELLPAFRETFEKGVLAVADGGNWTVVDNDNKLAVKHATLLADSSRRKLIMPKTGVFCLEANLGLVANNSTNDAYIERATNFALPATGNSHWIEFDLALDAAIYGENEDVMTLFRSHDGSNAEAELMARLAKVKSERTWELGYRDADVALSDENLIAIPVDDYLNIAFFEQMSGDATSDGLIKVFVNDEQIGSTITNMSNGATKVSKALFGLMSVASTIRFGRAFIDNIAVWSTDRPSPMEDDWWEADEINFNAANSGGADHYQHVVPGPCTVNRIMLTSKGGESTLYVFDSDRGKMDRSTLKIPPLIANGEPVLFPDELKFEQGCFFHLQPGTGATAYTTTTVSERLGDDPDDGETGLEAVVKHFTSDLVPEFNPETDL